MFKTQYINLNMIPSGVLPVLYVSQYDIGRPLGLVVYNGANKLNLTPYTVTLEAERSDGVAITAPIETDGNIGAFVTTATMTNKAEKYLAQMVIHDSEMNRIASLAFVMCITPAAMDENSQSIEEDKSLYQQYTETVMAFLTRLKNMLDSDGYYDLTVNTGVFTDSDGNTTDYYYVIIPKTDSLGDPINVYADYAPGTTPLTHAQEDFTTLTANSGMDSGGGQGAVVKDGVVLREADYPSITGLQNYLVYVGIDADRNVDEYPLTMTGEEMVAEGVQNACIAYYRLVTNGVVRDVTNIGLPSSNLKVNPRMCMFTLADGSIGFLACDGRSGVNEGLTPADLGTLVVSLGAVNAWNLDGGGSTSLVYKGSKQNRNIDGGGTIDRAISVTWNVPRKLENPAIQGSFNQTGMEKQNTIEQLMPYINRNSQNTTNGADVFELDAGMWYVSNAVNIPTGSHDDGFAVVYVRANHITERKVYWMPYDTQETWENTCDHGTWLGWCQSNAVAGVFRSGIVIPSGSDIDNYIITGKYAIQTASDAASMSNLPSDAAGMLSVEALNNNLIIEQLYVDINLDEWYRRGTISGGVASWLSWRRRTAAIGRSVSIAANSSKTISFSGSTTCFIMVRRTTTNMYGTFLYQGYGTTTSTQSIVDLSSGSLLTCVAAGNNAVTITNGSPNAITVEFTFMAGSLVYAV